MPTSEELNKQLVLLVGQVPGVTSMYSSEPAVSTAVKAAVGAIMDQPATVDRLSIEDTPDGLVVTVHIGVGSTDAANSVGRNVHDQIADNLRTEGVAVAKICVKIGRIG